MKELYIQVADFEEFTNQAKASARLIDGGDYAQQQAILSFASMDLLLKVLTTNRWTLLENLSEKGPCSIRFLSQKLGRDYRGVHADVQALLEQNLIERGPDGKISVPWSKITATFAIKNLAA